MSVEARQRLADHANIIYNPDVTTHRTDILDETKTNTYFIEGFLFLADSGQIIQFTAIHTDHHDDSDLNPEDPRHTGTHQGGVEPTGEPTGSWAGDFWFLNSRTPNDWKDANDLSFSTGLTKCSQVPNLLQVGLAGSAVNDENKHASGATVFIDYGGDHIHLGFA